MPTPQELCLIRLCKLNVEQLTSAYKKIQNSEFSFKRLLWLTPIRAAWVLHES